MEEDAVIVQGKWNGRWKVEVGCGRGKRTRQGKEDATHPPRSSTESFHVPEVEGEQSSWSLDAPIYGFMVLLVKKGEKGLRYRRG